jgi:putative transposase
MTQLLLTSFSDAERQQAMEHFAVIQPFLEDGVPLPTLAEQHGLALRTLRRWVARYRTHGLVGLLRKPRGDQGQRRRLAAEFQHVIEGLALRTPRPSIASVYRQAQKLASQHGWPCPSYGTVYAVIRQLPPALVTLAHEGASAYSDQFDLIYRREASCSNDIWQADHTPLDIWLLDERGIPARPWLTVILDDYSRGIAGYFLSFQHPSALHTALALRQAIWRKSEPHWHICGIPTIFYSDHGSDFTSHHLEQVAADLSLQLSFSYSARGRGKIERFFETVNQLFLCEQPGYTPPKTPPATPVLTLPVFEARFRTFLIETYHQRIHSEINMAPQARWEAGGFLPRLPDSLEQLDLLLLTVAKTRRVQQEGIRFQTMRYTDLTLAAYVGEEVTIRYDPRDMAEIRVYHEQRFLCRAICHELAHQTISLKELIRTRNRRRKDVRQALSDRLTLADAYLPREGPPPATQQLPAAADQEPSRPRLKRYYHE